MGSFRLRQCLKSYGDEMAPAFGPIGPRVRHLVRTLKMTFPHGLYSPKQQWNYKSTLLQLSAITRAVLVTERN